MNTGGVRESVVIGRFNGPWGVAGWVRVYSFTRPAERVFSYQPWQIGQSGRSVVVEQWQRSGPRLVALIEGVDSPEAAAALGHAEIMVDRNALPEPEDNHYYWSDLVGLEIVNLEQHVYGRVTGLLETGAHDVLEIRQDDAGAVLIPFVTDRFVRQVDLDAGRIVVDWPTDWVGPE